MHARMSMCTMHASTMPINRLRLFQFLHCKRPVHQASTQYGKNEGLWLSAHGHLLAWDTTVGTTGLPGHTVDSGC